MATATTTGSLTPFDVYERITDVFWDRFADYSDMGMSMTESIGIADATVCDVSHFINEIHERAHRMASLVYRYLEVLSENPAISQRPLTLLELRVHTNEKYHDLCEFHRNQLHVVVKYYCTSALRDLETNRDRAEEFRAKIQTWILRLQCTKCPIIAQVSHVLSTCDPATIRRTCVYS